MENILVGIIKFFGNTGETLVSNISLKKEMIYAFLILTIMNVSVYFLTKQF